MEITRFDDQKRKESPYMEKSRDNVQIMKESAYMETSCDNDPERSLYT